MISLIHGIPSGSDSKESAYDAGDLGWEDPLEKGIATHYRILAWETPWTEEPSRNWITVHYHWKTGDPG